MIPYTTQWQKITEAYMRGEINPLDATFCFCGTLCDNTNKWFTWTGRCHKDYGPYKGKHFVKMETALLDTFDSIGGAWRCIHPLYEQVLFDGMVAALEVLRQIHIEMGDETAINFGTPLQKRTLQTA